MALSQLAFAKRQAPSNYRSVRPVSKAKRQTVPTVSTLAAPAGNEPAAAKPLQLEPKPPQAHGQGKLDQEIKDITRRIQLLTTIETDTRPTAEVNWATGLTNDPEAAALAERISEFIATGPLMESAANILSAADILDLINYWAGFSPFMIIRAFKDTVKFFNWMGRKADDFFFSESEQPDLKTTDAQLLLKYGDAALHLEQYQEAVQFYSRAIRLKPTNAAVYNNLGIALALLGDYEHACSALQTALQQRPDYLLAQSNLGNIYTLMGQYQLAKTAYDQALRQQSQLAEIYFSRGSLQAQHGHLREAVEDYSQALRCKPGDPQFYYFRGIVHLKLNRYARARADFEQVLSSDPLHIASYLYLSLIELKTCRYVAAVTQTLRRDPQTRRATMDLIQARLWCRQHEFEAAARACTRALDRCPQRTDIRLERGLIHLKLGRFDAAIADLEGISTDHPYQHVIQQALILALSGLALQERERMPRLAA